MYCELKVSKCCKIHCSLLIHVKALTNVNKWDLIVNCYQIWIKTIKTIKRDWFYNTKTVLLHTAVCMLKQACL